MFPFDDVIMCTRPASMAVLDISDAECQPFVFNVPVFDIQLFDSNPMDYAAAESCHPFQYPALQYLALRFQRLHRLRLVCIQWSNCQKICQVARQCCLGTCPLINWKLSEMQLTFRQHVLLLLLLLLLHVALWLLDGLVLKHQVISSHNTDSVPLNKCNFIKMINFMRNKIKTWIRKKKKTITSPLRINHQISNTLQGHAIRCFIWHCNLPQTLSIQTGIPPTTHPPIRLSFTPVWPSANHRTHWNYSLWS